MLIVEDIIDQFLLYKEALSTGATVFFQFVSNNCSLGNGGLSKNRLLQYYEVLWIHC